MAMAAVTNAADMPRPTLKAQPAPPSVYNWSGFYIGGHAGASWADNRFFDALGGADAAKFTANGHFGGGQIGYNWQNGQWVLGTELEGSLSHLRRGVFGGFCGGFQNFGCGGGGFCGGFQNFGCSGGFGGFCGGFQNFGCFGGQVGARVQSLALLSARIGYAWDRTLFFVKGGGAQAHDKYVVNVPGVLSVTPTDTRVGWLVGAGIEYGLTPNWSGKVEYNYIDLGTERLNLVAPDGTRFVFDQSQQVHLLKFAINYRFAAPVR